MWLRRLILLAAAVFIFSMACGDDDPMPPKDDSGPKVVTLGTSKDNTLYYDVDGFKSNARGKYMFAGVTGVSLDDKRRALVHFDIAGMIPSGATIDSVFLDLNMSKTHSTAPATPVGLHTASQDWGSGSSAAAGEEGMGTNSTTGDATWLHTFFDTQLWTNQGGDFNPVASATTVVGVVGAYRWGSTAEMTADVQNWLDSPAGNYGWIIVGDESQQVTAKRFDTRENSTAANRPKLTVHYTP